VGVDTVELNARVLPIVARLVGAPDGEVAEAAHLSFGSLHRSRRRQLVGAYCMVAIVPVAVSARYAAKDFPHSSHRILAEWVGRDRSRVLDVGAATGHLGALLARWGHTVVGVEADPTAAAIAKPHYAAFHECDFEAMEGLSEAGFDVVIAGDVLEHLRDPAGGLRKMAELLGSGGRILVSVPNVAFIQVRLGLLCGRFEPAVRGILDATHLHFYTLRSFRRLIAEAGLRVTRFRGVPPPLPFLAGGFAQWPGRVFLEGANLAARVWPRLFAYQFIMEVRP
jgi:2-polyprenyl-3-methyl-5-hydroxy-6-metoxy-1,4-benzoquinol methylase